MENKGTDEEGERTVLCDQREAAQGSALPVIHPIMVHMGMGTGQCTKEQLTGGNLRTDTQER